jgi:ribonuclease VapC
VIVDSSALVAIVFREPGFEAIVDKLQRSTSSALGTPTLVEAGIVLTARLRRDGQPIIAGLVREFDLVEVPFGEAHAREAIRAYRRFGRGQHAANLNYGDCLAYAIASLADEPLLFTGAAFSATDLKAA